MSRYEREGQHERVARPNLDPIVPRPTQRHRSRFNAPAASGGAVKPRRCARRQPLTPEQSLRRSVLSCTLWENEFSEDGASVSSRIIKAANAVPIATLAALALEARVTFNLPHVPLLLLALLAQRGSGSLLVSEAISAKIGRADELGEFLVVYAKVNGVEPNAVTRAVRIRASNKAGSVKARTPARLLQIPGNDARMKLLLEIILSVVLHPIALVLMLIDIARRSDLSSGKKLLWALVGLLWGVGEILYITVGDGALW